MLVHISQNSQAACQAAADVPFHWTSITRMGWLTDISQFYSLFSS